MKVRGGGESDVFVEDPDGHTVEVFEHDKAASHEDSELMNLDRHRQAARGDREACAGGAQI